jgi:hypothetical protein
MELVNRYKLLITKPVKLLLVHLTGMGISRHRKIVMILAKIFNQCLNSF